MARFKSDTLTQCRLSRNTEKENQTAITVGWIESCFARVGNVLQDEDGEVWTVTDTYMTQPTNYIVDHERDYMKHRLGSDI